MNFNEEEYLKIARPREIVWYNRQKKLIKEKFDEQISPLPIEIFRRRNSRYRGLYCGDKIKLHNKSGTTRHTLLHEMLHHYFAKHKDYQRAHVKEFYDILKYLNCGGTITQYHEREKKQIEKINQTKEMKRNPNYKLEKIQNRIKIWESKFKRAENALKKLRRKEKQLSTIQVPVLPSTAWSLARSDSPSSNSQPRSDQ